MADPPLRRPSRQRLPPVRRPWPVAVLQARAAVARRMPLDGYLRSRLARYLVRLPVARSSLPVQLEVTGGEIVVTRRNDPAPEPTPQRPDAWAEALVALEGPSILREVPELEARIASLDAELAGARRHVDELAERFAADLAAGTVAAVPRPEEAAELLGRPPVRSVGPELALLGFALATVLAQCWAVAVPALVAAGQYPVSLDGQGWPELLEPLLTCTFALGVTLGLLGLALTGLRAADDFASAMSPAGRRRARAAAIVAALAAAATAAGAATLPAARSGLPPPTHALLLLSVSAGAALLLRQAQRERAGRAAEAAEALAWDRERARTLGERARRLEQLDAAGAAVGEIARRRAGARLRLEQLARRAAAATRLVAQAEAQAWADRDRLARSLVAALERDRYEFLREATARGATELLAAPWKPAAEPRPAPAEAAPRPEPGRMAG